MGFVKMNCPNCGANIELSEDREYGFCSFCGTKIVQDKIVVEHHGQVSIDGIANADALIDRAFLLLEDGDFTKAAFYLEKVLDINPRCARAYIGNLLCQLHYRKIEQLSTCQKPLECFSLYNKAIRFATSDELKEYQGYNEKATQNYNEELNKRQSQIRDIETNISNQKQYLETNKKERLKTEAKRVLRILLLIIGIFGTLFCLTGLLVADKQETGFYIFIIITLLLFLALSIYMIIQIVKANRFIADYNSIKVQLESLNKAIKQAQADLDSWKEAMLKKQ